MTRTRRRRIRRRRRRRNRSRRTGGRSRKVILRLCWIGFAPQQPGVVCQRRHGRAEAKALPIGYSYRCAQACSLCGHFCEQNEGGRGVGGARHPADLR